MKIPQKLLKYKLYFALILFLSLALSALFFLAPRFLPILTYFWPLFLSTALFLLSVVVFGRISVPVSDESAVDKAGEGLLDYVAGQPDNQHPLENFKPDDQHPPESFKSE